MSETSQDSLRTRATLLNRIKNLEDSPSWGEFVGLYQRFVFGVARQRGLNPEDAEDVAQEVFSRVAQTIHRFEPRERRGSFRRWLSQLTRWRAADKLRLPERRGVEVPRDEPSERETTLEERVACADVTEAEFEQEARRCLLSHAFKRMEQKVSPKQIQVFQLLVLQSEPVERVCELLKMNRTAVYVAKHRVAERLREEVACLRRELE